MYNYVGVICVALACAAIAARHRQPYVVALALAGVIGLLLSFGPALKLNNVRGPSSDMPTSTSYLLPISEATAELPWDSIYKVPGLAQMRAKYRWSAVTRLALIVLAAVAVEWLLTRGRSRIFVIGVASAAIIEWCLTHRRCYPNTAITTRVGLRWTLRSVLSSAPQRATATWPSSSARMVTTTTT
jgi:hypothetical protein